MIAILLPRAVVAALTLVLICGSLVVHFAVLLPFSLVKLLVPHKVVRLVMTRAMLVVARQFIRSNAVLLRLLFPVRWQIRIDGELDPGKSYLLVSNHQSWIDIILLFDVFRGRVPWLRFFLKRELIYVPIIGFVCWAFDFPFMKRYPREVIEKHPELAREDLEATRRACERFRETPVTIVNFIEGTRFTPEKHAAKRSPYRYLLPPKSGGLAFAVGAMGREVAGLVDVTVCYRPTDWKLIWSFCGGEQRDIIIEAKLHAIPEELLDGDYQGDAEYRRRFQSWVGELWRAKDARLASLHAEQASATQQAARPREE